MILFEKQTLFETLHLLASQAETKEILIHLPSVSHEELKMTECMKQNTNSNKDLFIWLYEADMCAGHH